MTPADAETLQAYLVGVDHTARSTEQKWGFDRLPLLVDAELRAKFMRQQVSWRTALEEAYGAKFLTAAILEAVKVKAAAMQRAWAALDAAATEAGHRDIQPWVWEVVLQDGTVAAFVQTNAEASRVIADGRYVVVWTAEEIGRIIDLIPSVMTEAKRVFPGVKVVGTGDRSWLKNGDPIPFGDPVIAQAAE